MDNGKSPRIYTGTGDGGRSDTLAQKNISKASPIFEVLGSLDECSAFLGLARSSLDDERLCADILTIQKRLIEVCGELAGGECAVCEGDVRRIEEAIDGYCALSGGFCGFSVSGATRGEAAINLARTSVRRAERAAAAIEVTPEMRKYINRLSDLLYVMAEYAAHVPKTR